MGMTRFPIITLQEAVRLLWATAYPFGASAHAITSSCIYDERSIPKILEATVCVFTSVCILHIVSIPKSRLPFRCGGVSCYDRWQLGSRKKQTPRS
ncbi:hypothetical protein BKA59DRAFT_479953 [Fusarium tricinctum]|uniref:Uncharacterized protein n=1 Tax=Fusarium tricinctum TaxID=61284 RepID=A0A8K0RXP8_9HYPO|nr:hypothetical protein BKA59DRAFT_479953 [Fusarium tricinctum]